MVYPYNISARESARTVVRTITAAKKRLQNLLYKLIILNSPLHLLHLYDFFFNLLQIFLLIDSKFGFVSTPGAESVRCAVQNSTRPNPTNIVNANPNPPTPADRVVPVHSWRLVIVPCWLILCASLVRFCLNARSRVCALCSSEFNPTQPDQYR